MYVLVSEHKNCMRIPLEKERERAQPSQSDYIVILKIFRSSSKTLNIVTGSRVPPGRRRWSVCGGWVGERDGEGGGGGVTGNQTNTPATAATRVSRWPAQQVIYNGQVHSGG